MAELKGKAVLVTGASSGIGKATAERLLDEGWTVYAGALELDRMQDLEQRGAHVLNLDVTDDELMVAAVRAVESEQGAVDALINNAGYGEYGALEDVPIGSARYQMEVNVFGLARMIQLVLPNMRQMGAGRIVNISSVGGKMAFPTGSWYHASKFSVEAISDALRLEVKPFGIDVVVVEPGPIYTNWQNVASEQLDKHSAGGAYTDISAGFQRLIKAHYNQSTTGPEAVADVIFKALTARRPRARYAVPFQAKAWKFIRWLLPDRMCDAVLRRRLG